MNNNGTYVIVLILIVMAIRVARSGGKERRVRIETLWVPPIILAVLIGFGVARTSGTITPSLAGIALGAFLVGLGIGWYRGRLTRLTIDPETHTLKGQTSAVGLIIIALLFLARSEARQLLTSHAAAWHISPMAVVDGFMLLALGMIVGRRLEIYLRCLALLKQARAAKATGEIVSSEPDSNSSTA